MTIWQIGAGEGDRDYSDLFLRYDVICAGPGRYGSFTETDYRPLVDAEDITRSRLSMFQQIAERMVPGDVVLLRKAYRVVGIGTIPEDDEYAWREAFDDVYGWDLQHSRRVRWHRPSIKALERLQKKRDVFTGRKQIPTLTRVRDEKILKPLRNLIDAVEGDDRELSELPVVPRPMGLPELGQQLFAQGVSNRTVDDLLRAFEGQRRLANWYRTSGEKPSEHEVVAHLVLPMMLALGWSEQRLAVEWYQMDLVAFSKTPREDDNCVLVCEAKTTRNPLQAAVYTQAKDYVEGWDLGSCRRILLTNGIQFYVYEREASGGWPETATAYMNILKLRESHLVPAGTSAVDAILHLAPWTIRA